MEIDHYFQSVPELAESWDSTPDAKKWTFKLRKGIEFHNGKTMTAEDVVFSINHHLGEESKSAAKGYLKSITNIKATENMWFLNLPAAVRIFRLSWAIII